MTRHTTVGPVHKLVAKHWGRLRVESTKAGKHSSLVKTFYSTCFLVVLIFKNKLRVWCVRGYHRQQQQASHQQRATALAPCESLLSRSKDSWGGGTSSWDPFLDLYKDRWSACLDFKHSQRSSVTCFRFILLWTRSLTSVCATYLYLFNLSFASYTMSCKWYCCLFGVTWQ